jgi:DNA-binding IclR family transcriptional regulator
MIEQPFDDLDGFEAQVLDLLAEHGRPIVLLQLAVELGARDTRCDEALHVLEALGLARRVGRRFEATDAGAERSHRYGTYRFVDLTHARNSLTSPSA